MKNKKSLIIKSTMVILLAVYLILLYRADYAKDVSMDTIAQSMEKYDAITQLGQEDRVQLKRCYQINDTDTDGYFFYKSASPMAVEEAFIVKAKDKSQAESFLTAAQDHLSSQKNIFGGYGTDQMALLNKAEVGSKGNYVYYFCGEDASSWRQAFLSLI